MSIADREKKPGSSAPSTPSAVGAPAEKQTPLSFRLAAQAPLVPAAPATDLRVQRLASGEAAPALSELDGVAPAAAGALAAFIVEDDATAALLPSQMRKSSFLEALRQALTAALGEAFVGTPYSAAGCPTLEKWLKHYEGRSAAQLEGAVRRYSGAGSSLSAADFIAAAATRVRLAGARWVATGEITGTPDLLAAAAAEGQEAPARGEEAPAVMLLSKGGPAAAPAHPVAVQQALGPGAGLPGEVRGEMEAGFGGDLGAVRVHTDARAGSLARAYGAHAFTVGQHIAFAPGAYAPGTLRGDLVLAHEVAHTRQQRAGGAKVAAPAVAESRDHEHAADEAAIGVMARLYGGGQRIAQLLGESVSSVLASPLALQRCRSDKAPETIKSGLDRGQIEAAGAAVKLDDPAVAAKANDKQWSGKRSAKNRVDLLTWLRNGIPAKVSDTFTAADVLAIARLQQGTGIIVPSGKTDDATLAVLLHAGLKFSDEAVQKPDDVVIEMFPGELEDLAKWKQRTWNGQTWQMVAPPPGEGKLYVKVRGQLVAKYDVRGGPPFKFSDGKHTAGPTEAGTYHLGPERAHTSKVWKFSQIQWGAALKKDASGEILFKEGNGEWQYATGPKSKLSIKFDKTDGAFWKDGSLKPTWDRNDFGPASWKLVPDGKGPSDQYVHTTPYEEARKVDDNLQLECSHGCVHTNPQHRDEMVARGYLQKGVKFVVHTYDEHLLPEKARKAMMP